MADYEVAFHEAAELELVELYHYIADQADPQTAWNFISGIRAFCLQLTTFPERGTERKDLRRGLRIIGYKRRVSIAFSLRAGKVMILGIFYGGRQIKVSALRKRQKNQNPNPGK